MKVNEKSKMFFLSIFTGFSGTRPKTTTLPLSADALVNIQLNTGLLNISMKKLVKAVNQTAGTKLVEPNFPLNFKVAGKQLSDFFTMSEEVTELMKDQRSRSNQLKG